MGIVELPQGRVPHVAVVAGSPGAGGSGVGLGSVGGVGGVSGGRRRRARVQGGVPALGLWVLRVLVAVGLAVVIGYLPYHLYLRSGLSLFMAQRAELERLEQQNRELRGRNTELRLQLSRIQEDDGEIERVARDELGLVRAGELVFKVE